MSDSNGGHQPPVSFEASISAEALQTIVTAATTGIPAVGQPGVSAADEEGAHVLTSMMMAALPPQLRDNPECATMASGMIPTMLASLFAGSEVPLQSVLSMDAATRQSMTETLTGLFGQLLSGAIPVQMSLTAAGAGADETAGGDTVTQVQQTNVAGAGAGAGAGVGAGGLSIHYPTMTQDALNQILQQIAAREAELRNAEASQDPGADDELDKMYE